MYFDGEHFRTIECNCWSPEKRLEDSGVDVQVLSTIPVLFSYAEDPTFVLETSIFLNNHISEVVKKHPKKYIGLGTVPLQHPVYAIQEMRRVVLELGFPGIQIGSHVGEMNLDAVFHAIIKI